MLKKLVLGKEEWCELPELGLPAIKVRVDSGAKTSSLHALNIRPFEEDSKKYVYFDIHPIQNDRKIIQTCKALVVDQRNVKSSSGEKEKRHVIKTTVKMGDHAWEIEITLTNRDSMGYRMLLGREAMSDKVLISPHTSFKLGKILAKDVRKLYKKTASKKERLKIVLLASNPDLYSNRRLIEAGEQRGHDMRFINISHCYMNISSNNPEVHYRGGEILHGIDAVIPRIRPAVTFYGCAVTRQFHSTGSFCLNDAVSIARSRDKLRSLQMLANKKIAMPVTGFANSPLDTNEIIKMVGGAPLIVKLLEGTQGKGVVMAETANAAESVINAFKSLQVNILVQEYIKEAGGKDLRCFVIDGKVVGSIQRQAAEGDFRANLHLGGKASAVKITAEEKEMAIKATKVMGLDVAGVDIIRSKTGPKILEINSSPGLEGIEGVTGKDIAGMMIECIERHVKERRKSKVDD